MPKLTNHLNANQKQLQNAVIHKLSAAPSTPVSGQMYYDTDDNSFYVCTATSPSAVWKKLNDQTMTASEINTALGTITTGEIGFNTTLNMNGKAITGVVMPTVSPADNDAANRKFVTDSVNAAVQGLDVKQSVVAISTAITSGPAFVYSSSNGGTITYALEASDSVAISTFDGVTIAVNDRVLINHTSSEKNGFYTVHQATPTIELRRTDFLDGSTAQQNAFAFVEKGTKYADTGWVLSSAISTVGIGPIAFTQFSSAGVITNGTGIAKSGNTLSIDTANGYGVRKKVSNIGDGTATSITYVHNLDTKNVTVAVIDNSTDELVLADVLANNVDSVQITFDTAPTLNQYRVVVIG